MLFVWKWTRLGVRTRLLRVPQSCDFNPLHHWGHPTMFVGSFIPRNKRLGMRDCFCHIQCISLFHISDSAFSSSFCRHNMLIRKCASLIGLGLPSCYHTVLEILLRKLVILFHPNISSPLGSRGVYYKKRAPLEILPLTSSPTADSNRSFRCSPWRQTYLVPSTSQDPRATNARAELTGTGHTAKFQQAFYLQT